MRGNLPLPAKTYECLVLGTWYLVLGTWYLVLGGLDNTQKQQNQEPQH